MRHITRSVGPSGALMCWRGYKQQREERGSEKISAWQCHGTAFENCHVNCKCNEIPCIAIGLNKCPVWKPVLKSNCGKLCQIDSRKPVKLRIAAASTPNFTAGYAQERKLVFDDVSDSSDSECVRKDVEVLGEILISAVKVNRWEVVTHEGEKWVGRVLEKCLTKFEFNVCKSHNG